LSTAENEYVRDILRRAGLKAHKIGERGAERVIPPRPFMFNVTEAPPFVNSTFVKYAEPIKININVTDDLKDAMAYMHSKIQQEAQNIRDKAYSQGERVMPNFNEKGWINYIHSGICKMLKPLYANGTLVKRYETQLGEKIEDAQWIEKSVNLLEKK
jgi:hypothetical protein